MEGSIGLLVDSLFILILVADDSASVLGHEGNHGQRKYMVK
jgi:hypothetical protein